MSKINVSELDFPTIKAALKDYLRGQTEFQDYDFEGSGMNIILDMLAYNTHYMGVYAHMLYNESFLDSAAKRTSVVSNAKHLNYTTKSIQSAQAVVTVNITPSGSPVDIVIPKYTQFNSNIDSKNFTFTTLEEYVATPTGFNNVYRAQNVKLVQGVHKVLAFTVDTTNPDQKFILPFANIDTQHLKVVVQTSAGNTASTTFTYSDTILEATPSTPYFYLQEVEGGKFEIVFGDGVVGKALVNGNIIIVDYVLTDGEDANNASLFIPINTIGGQTTTSITTVQPASGGRAPQSLDEIRLLAPRFYESQKRAVTVQDYQTILLNNVSLIQQNFESVAVWGGEDNIPPKYGNVFISLKPKTGVLITNFLKDQIRSELIDRLNVIGIIPEIVDPEYLNLEITASVNFAQNKTTKGRTDIQNIVSQTIKSYRDNVLAFFDSGFRYSDLTILVETSDPSIENNLINIRMKRTVPLTFNQSTFYEVYFYNAIEPKTLNTTAFFVTETGNLISDKYYLKDDGEGKIILYKKKADGTFTNVNTDFGTIDYATGYMAITTFNPIRLVDSSSFEVSAKPAINNIDTVRNMIITYRDADINVTANAIIV